MYGQVADLQAADVPNLDIEVEIAPEQGRPGLVDLLPMEQGLHGEQAGNVR